MTTPAATALVSPDPLRREAWQAAVDEFGDSTIHGSGFWHLDDAARRALTDEEYADLVTGLLAQTDPATVIPDDPVSGRTRVHCSYFWITDGPADTAYDAVGFLALRHELNDWLLNEGGHIGYSVRPSRRREGHATRALGLGVRRAAGLGLPRVLVTCDEDNLVSARTIELNGGVYEDSRSGRRRYWIETAD